MRPFLIFPFLSRTLPNVSFCLLWYPLTKKCHFQILTPVFCKGKNLLRPLLFSVFFKTLRQLIGSGKKNFGLLLHLIFLRSLLVATVWDQTKCFCNRDFRCTKKLNSAFFKFSRLCRVQFRYVNHSHYFSGNFALSCQLYRSHQKQLFGK